VRGLLAPRGPPSDLEVEPNGDLYAATYGLGIWKIAGATVGATPADGGILGPSASRAGKTG
jgi:hypothetical protein